MSISDTANKFFDACETGKGWDACKGWCNADASFSAQADALADVKTLAAYCDWMKGLFGPVPDGNYVLKGMAVDAERQVVLAYAVFHGTNTAQGAAPPTGKTVASDYVYAIEFQGDKIKHMTKIWNDVLALRQLGWG